MLRALAVSALAAFEVDDFDADPVSQFHVQAIFGSVSVNVIEGFVSATVLGAPMQGQFLGASPNGTFHVWAGRYFPGPADQPAGVELTAGAPTSAR